MVRTLRFRIIAVTLASLSFVIFAIIFTINMLSSVWLIDRADDMLNIISEFNGKLPNDANELGGKVRFTVDSELPYRTRYFVIKIDSDGEIYEKMLGNIASVNDEELLKYCDLTKGLKDGTRGSVDEYRYLVHDNGHGGKMVSFLDLSPDREALSVFTAASTITGVIGLIFVLVVIIIASTRILKPFVENQEKQKQFITDAGHELKTPLAIIRTNAEVLEMCNGSNEWIDSIKNQTVRLDGLIKGLLRLSKSGELEDEQPVTFSLSGAVNEVSQPFKTLADQKGIKMHFDITPSIDYKGSQQSISTLVSILVDNAIKYAAEGGEIIVALSRMGMGTLKTAKLVVENDTDIPATEDPTRFFERFYRSDGSRARETGGYGIGLSVAQTIVKQHKGKITVDRTGDRIVFTVIL
ncbi:MAG: two-component sensor histidine kinase [Clostridia bacterium]|nr:two-component sensor histidine kinase [Clostridia bacterium]